MREHAPKWQAFQIFRRMSERERTFDAFPQCHTFNGVRHMRTEIRVSDLRAAIEEARRYGAMPEDAPEGWSVHPTDPARILQSFPPLGLKTEYQLVAYQYRAGGNGNAVVYALPRDVPVPTANECPRDEAVWLTPPRPSEALADVRLAFEGDGSPQSYIAASVAYRELCEMGAAWHGASWSMHELMAVDPRRRRKSSGTRSRSRHQLRLDELTWDVPELDEWAPHVDAEGAHVTVRFVTASALGSERIELYEDRYTRNNYLFESNSTQIATGGTGYIF